MKTPRGPMIADVPDTARSTYVSSPIRLIPAKLARETVYLPSIEAQRLLGADRVDDSPGRRVTADPDPS